MSAVLFLKKLGTYQVSKYVSRVNSAVIFPENFRSSYFRFTTVAGEWHTLSRMQEISCKRYSDKPLFGTNGGNGFDWMSYQDFGNQVDSFRASLALNNVNKGDRVALVCNNCVEWAVIAYAVYGRGAILVPMYENQAESDVQFILQNSGASTLVVGTKQLLKTYYEVIQCEDYAVKNLICLEDPEGNLSSNLSTFKSELKKGSSSPSAVVEVRPVDISTLIYTSGTTGRPKGVMLSHANICSNVKAVSTVLGEKINSDTRSLAFLTWAHVFGQTMELHQVISKGASMGLTQPRQIMTDIKLVKPTILVAVPIVYEKVYDSVLATVRKNSLISLGFDMAMSVAKQRRDFFDSRGGRGWTPSLWFKWHLAKLLVFDRILASLGGNLQWAATGGSKCPEKIQDFFDLIGIPLIEGYGSTETSPVITMERYAPTEKTQGGQRPLPGISLKICDESGQSVKEGEVGEICAAGPNIMIGYWNDPENSLKAFYEFNDGRKYFRTGDSGVLRSDPQTAGIVLEIRGRIKSAFKLANGKFVNPDTLEEIANSSGYCSQASLFGLNQKSTILIFHPRIEQLNEMTVPDLVDALSQHLASTVEKQYTIPQAYILLSNPLTIENGFLTPKQSIKRNKLEENLKDHIQDLYRRVDAGEQKPFIQCNVNNK